MWSWLSSFVVETACGSYFCSTTGLTFRGKCQNTLFAHYINFDSRMWLKIRRRVRKKNFWLKVCDLIFSNFQSKIDVWGHFRSIVRFMEPVTWGNGHVLCTNHIFDTISCLTELRRGSTTVFVWEAGILIFEISRKIPLESCLRVADRSYFQNILFSSPILCVDSISEISLVISFLPTE